MRIVFSIIRGFIFLLLLVLALANTQIVSLNFVIGYTWTAPLILIGLAFFSVGILTGFLFCLPKIIEIWFENYTMIRNLRRSSKNMSEKNNSGYLPR
ncbi:MAG: LapA family protein [Burkholderia sp.]|nr:LapA family protein [Burkholderia sp.]